MRLKKKLLIEEMLKEGRISVDLEHGHVFGKRGNVMGSTHNTGYVQVLITYKGKKYYFNVHDIIAVAGGLDVVGKTINHIDCDKTNNSIHNLEAVEHRENIKHAYENGLIPRKRKLSEKDVALIKALSKEGVSRGKIAKVFNISTAHVRYIVNGRRKKGVKVC